ncbi:MAG: hypothetical protein IJU48_09140 [Synergistaceae bacterium]|nr:hypothetical protein [Synergistaceae bacterium]
MRLFITTLSLFSVIAFGYALAGYGSSLFGNAINLEYVIGGLSAGFFFGGLAMFLWYRHRKDFFDYDDNSEA